MRVSSYLSVAAMAVASVHAVAAPAESADAKATKFNVSQQTQVPGMTLQPGTYSIRVVDHLADRLIVRIDGASGGSQHSTFIGLPNTGLPKSGSGIIAFDSGGDGGAAARGFSFPGGRTVEFVYPKADAVSLAKANGTKVVAIDPASEGRVPTETGLSKDDMEVVTLWTLSSTKVGAGDAAPAISAEKYRAKRTSAAANTEVASAGQDAPNAAAPRAQKPVIAKLPHTGSDLPLVAMLAFFALLGAAGLRLGRLALLSR